MYIVYCILYIVYFTPANTGKDKTNNAAVINIAQTYKLYWLLVSNDIPKIVLIKLIAPNNELRPLRCKLTIVLSTAIPLWLLDKDKVG
jgi:hypothetical protein